MVYCEELKCWCRAVIKSIVSSADHYLTECFLVDFAKYLPVKSKKYVCIIYFALCSLGDKCQFSRRMSVFKVRGESFKKGRLAGSGFTSSECKSRCSG